MDRVFISSAAVSHPAYRLDQAEAAARIGVALGASRRVAAIARGTRIQSRSLALTPAEIAGLGGIEERNRRYSEIAPLLAENAARAALAGPRRPVGLLAVSSCTGYLVPGLDVALAGRLGLDCDTARLPITEAGCAGGVVALARAADFLRSHTDQSALVVAVEVCSLAFHADAEDGNLISALIFGDGAGAALLTNSEPRPGDLEIVDAASLLLPGTRDAIGFDLTGRGFYPVLTRELADLLPAPAARLAGLLLARNGLKLGDVSSWLLHPGGPRIIERIEAALELNRDQTRWSWQSLAEFGNTSSAAVFDVLHRYMNDDSAPRGWVMVVAFGPGVSIEALLVRRW